MTQKQARELPCGIYNIYWKHSGGMSVAAVGMRTDGTRWLAPTNWIEPDVSGSNWRKIEKVEQIEINKPRN